MNIATVLTGSRDHDLPEKLVWAKPLVEDYQHNVYILGRVKQTWQIPRHFSSQNYNRLSLVCMYDSANSSVDYDISKQKDLENWLGISFRYLSSLDWRGFDRRNPKDIRASKETYRYLSYLTDFFRDFLMKNNIEIVVITMESFLWNLVLYYVARKLGIPIVTIVGSRFLPGKGVMFCKENFSDVWCWNEDEKVVQWEEICSLYANRAQAGSGKVGLASYWHPKPMFTNLSKAFKYVSIRRSMIQMYEYEKCALLPISTEIKRAIWATSKGILNRIFYQKPSGDKQFFFLPLHYEDDAQITLREPFTNQFDLVASISRCLPQGVQLYVKPHPDYVGTDIRFRDLLRISKLSNVRILHPRIPAIALIKGSVGVITLNSTTGFEALIFEKPLISLGHDFYCREDLCYLVRDWDELPAVIFKVFQERKNPSSVEHIRNFVKMVYANSVFTAGSIGDGVDPFTNDDGAKIALVLDKIFRNIKNRAGSEFQLQSK